MKVFREQEFWKIMQELATLLQVRTYVELGVRKGFTFRKMMEVPCITHLVGVDPAGFKNIPVPAADDPSLRTVDLHIKTSEDFFSEWKDPIDMIFIDADHRKESVLNDFRMAEPFIRPGTGLVFLHDTHPVDRKLLAEGYCSNAWEAARFIFKNKEFKDWEIVTIPGPYAGISICRKAKEHLQWMIEEKKAPGLLPRSR